MAQLNNSRIAKNTLYLYLRSFVTLLISLYTSRIVLGCLGVEDYGIYNVVGGVIGMLSFLNNSMASSYQRYFNYEMGRHNEQGVASLFKSSLTVQLFYAIIIVLIAETLGLWFLENKLVIDLDRMDAARWIYHISVFSFVLMIFQAPFNALIISYEKMGIFAYISILDSVLKLVIVLVLPLFAGDKLIVYGVLGLLIIVVNFFIYLFVCRLNFSTCRLALNWEKNNIRRLLSFSSWGMIDSLSYTLINQGVNIVLNLFFGTVVNAARGVSYQVLTAVNQFITGFQTSFRPQLTKSYAEGNLVSMYKLYYTATKVSCYLIWCISLPILFETQSILELWLGNNIPDYTIIFVRLILLTALVNVFANPTSCIAFSTGNIKWFTIIVSGINLLNLPVVYFFLKLGYSPASALYVVLFMSIIVQIIRLLVLKKLLPFSLREYLNQVVLPTFSVLLFSIIIPFLLKNIMVECLISTIIVSLSAFLSVLIMVWIIGLEKYEKNTIKIKVKDFFN